MADEPMTDERLAEIRARAEAIRNWLLTPESDGKGHFPTSRRLLGVDALALLAEVERRRAREAAALAIAEAVASVLWTSYCPWCNRHGMMQEVDHYDDCPVLAARALTGITPPEDD